MKASRTDLVRAVLGHAPDLFGFAQRGRRRRGRTLRRGWGWICALSAAEVHATQQAIPRPGYLLLPRRGSHPRAHREEQLAVVLAGNYDLGRQRGGVGSARPALVRGGCSGAAEKEMNMPGRSVTGTKPREPRLPPEIAAAGIEQNEMHSVWSSVIKKINDLHQLHARDLQLALGRAFGADGDENIVAAYRDAVARIVRGSRQRPVRPPSTGRQSRAAAMRICSREASLTGVPTLNPTCARRCADDANIIMRVLERPDLGGIALVADQQRQTLLILRLRRKREKQGKNRHCHQTHMHSCLPSRRIAIAFAAAAGCSQVVFLQARLGCCEPWF